MLQENAISGLFFLVGISYGSLYMGIGTLLATIIGTATAYLLKYDIQETEKGLYGFSAALVGAATFLFLEPVFISWIIVVLGSICAALLQHFFIKRKIAAFTFPFVLVTWIIILEIRNWAPDLLLTSSPITLTEADKYLFPFKGFGQVIFQGSLISGVLFFIAVFINSRISALYGFIGALISGFIAYCFSLGHENIENGIWGYNAVLCAIVFAEKIGKNVLWALISILISVIIQLVMTHFNFLVLTFPFVLASFITLLLKAKYETRQ